MAENKMEAVATLLGKRLGERFKVECEGMRYECRFYTYGLSVKQKYNNPYIHIDIGPHLLQDLIAGQAVIVDD